MKTPERDASRAGSPDDDAAAAVEELYTDGIVGLKGAFAREWVAALREEVDRALVLGVDAPGTGNAEQQDMAVTKELWAALPHACATTRAARSSTYPSRSCSSTPSRAW